jgi:hypothetical protein
MNYAKLTSTVQSFDGAFDEPEEFMDALSFSPNPALIVVGPPDALGHVLVDGYFDFGATAVGLPLTVGIYRRLVENLSHSGDTLSQVQSLPGSVAFGSQAATAGVPEEIVMFTVPEIRVGEDVEVGRYLDITNLSETLPLHISLLQVALSAVDVDPANLTYDDPVLNGLAWYTIIGEPTDFDPGQTRTYDVPDEPPITQNVYWRARMARTSADPQESLVSVTPPAPEQSIPTISSWGLVTLALLLLTAGKLHRSG